MPSKQLIPFLVVATLTLPAFAKTEDASTHISIIAESDSVGDIVVEIVGGRSNEGRLIIGLYNHAKISKLAYAWKKIDTTAQVTQTIIFEDVPYGEYAIFVVHDITGDGEFTMRWFPLPKPLDGGGYSNHAKARFGPAKYQEAKFRHVQSTTVEEITLIYE